MAQSDPYADVVGEPKHWIDLAEQLLNAARELEPTVAQYWEDVIAVHRDRKESVSLPDYRGVHFMLVAYALENLLKAAIVKSDPAKYRSEASSQQLPRDLKGHSLIDLAKRAGLKADVAEEGLFLRLTRNSVWSGRYPVPIKAADAEQIVKLSDGSDDVVSFYTGTDIDELQQLLNRVRKELGV